MLLPCNVIVYKDNGAVTVSAIVPSVAMGFVDNPKLKSIAEEVDKLASEIAETEREKNHSKR